MIKKLLLLILVIVGVYGFYTAFTAGYVGIQTGSLDWTIKVVSYDELKENKDKLDKDIRSLEQLNSSTLSEAVDSVKFEKANYENKKGVYDALAISASVEEIAEANKIERYLLDYLWIRVGNYANDNGVKFKMTPNSADATLSFDITGSYVAVINFIYDIQNDNELDFKVDGIVVQGGSSDQIVKANFIVRDVNVVTSPEE